VNPIMNDSYLLAVISACWLGVLTSISPCPLATNIVAISYIGKRVDRPRYVLASGLLYTLGRTLAYVILGALIVASALAIPDLSFFLQKNMNKFLGPILLIVGLFLIGIFRFSISGPGFGQKLQGRLEKYGFWGAGILGLLFALSFCPVSAALFFGSLIPIAVKHNSNLVMPIAYGIGTALPVVAFAIIIALGANYLGSFFNKLTVFEMWARKVTGILFILIGIYFILTYILHLSVL